MEEGYYCLTKHASCSIPDLTPRYLSLFLRRAGLVATSLQDLARVGEGEGGVGSLGNSWLSYKASYSYADKIDESFHVSAVLAV